MRQRNFIAGLASTTVPWPLAARAQQAAGVRRVGVLSSYTKDEAEILGYLVTLHEALAKLGWIEGEAEIEAR